MYARVVVLSSLEMIRNAFKEDALSGRADFEFLRERSEDKKGILYLLFHSVSNFTIFSLL